MFEEKLSLNFLTMIFQSSLLSLPHRVKKAIRIWPLKVRATRRVKTRKKHPLIKSYSLILDPALNQEA